MKTPQLLDHRGIPIKKAELRTEVAAATVGGVRSPTTGYPGDGLNPSRLAQVLREADMGDPIRYLELAQTIEERDAHYLAVLATRRRSVSQNECEVEAGSDAPEHLKHAEMVRTWLKRDELAEDLFDILDCIGKGYSFTEITWDTSEGQWMPHRLDWRDPRWFRFDRHDLTTPVMLNATGQEEPLPGFKFIYANIKAKSGLPLRSGLARVAAWGWMFKAYTQRDWAIFTQTYGQPLRVGKFGSGASEADKSTLLRAVTNIAGDCAAIVPDTMMIEFIETSNVGSSTDLYLKRIDHLDQQISKLVLGQTATTDAVTGGLGSGKEHREVQKDIETADARALAAILNRDLIRPWIDLNYGPQTAYPRLKIVRPEPEDLAAFSTAVGAMIDRGLEVDQAEVREKFGLSEPKAGAKLMGAARANAPANDLNDPNAKTKSNPAKIKRVEPVSDGSVALNQEDPLAGKNQGSGGAALLADRLAIEAEPAMADIMAQIEAMLAASGSLEEFREMLLAGFPKLDASKLVGAVAMGLLAGNAAGRIEVLLEEAQ